MKHDPKLPVQQLLAIELSPQPGSRITYPNLTEWFATAAVNFVPETIQDLILPAAQVCENLDSYLPEALEKGCVSVHHPVRKEIFLPLWVARAWKWANASRSKASFWNATLT